MAEEVRASFHHNDQLSGSSDGESKPVRAHPETGTAALHMRVPKHRRTTSKRRGPARGSKQVIDSRIVVT